MAAEQVGEIPDKLYFKIGEVCELTGVKQHVLRYWESEFHHIKPQRIGSSQRLYRRSDIDNILVVKKLLKEEGLSIPGAKKFLARSRHIESPEISDNIKQAGALTLLEEIKKELHTIRKILEE